MALPLAPLSFCRPALEVGPEPDLPRLLDQKLRRNRRWVLLEHARRHGIGSLSLSRSAEGLPLPVGVQVRPERVREGSLGPRKRVRRPLILTRRKHILGAVKQRPTSPFRISLRLHVVCHLLK